MIELDVLNEKQRQAVTVFQENVLVLAGAGSGKTSVLTKRIAWLVNQKNVPLKSILAVTFTNKAAQEMKDRITSLLGYTAINPYIGTFHGIAYRILRQFSEEIGLPNDFIILDSDDQLSLIKKVLKLLNINDKNYNPRGLRSFIGSQKDQGISISSYINSDIYDPLQIKVFEYYEKMRIELNALDFSDLLSYVYRLFSDSNKVREYYQNRFNYVLVDEFQDTNTLQYNWLRLLVSGDCSIMAVGDDDQSIYGWRGANVKNITNFQKDYQPVKLIKLEQNYRSTQTILDVANAVISNNNERLGKNLWSDKETGNKVSLYNAYNERDEAYYVAKSITDSHLSGVHLQDMAVLYRSNAQSRLLEEALINLKIPYKIYGGLRFFERAEVKDILSYVRLVYSRHDDLAFSRVLNKPTRGIGATTYAKLTGYSSESGLSLWDSAIDMINKKLLTIRSINMLKIFLKLIDDLEILVRGLELGDKVRLILEQSGLLEFHNQDKGEKAAQRIENMKELVSSAKNFSSLSDAEQSNQLRDFIAFAVLESGDTQAEGTTEAVNLMTLHSAKGLEFENVYIVGLEEDIFPTSRSKGDDLKISEERRLCYVGITRAMKNLSFTYASSRYQYGETTFQRVSRFIDEIPSHYIRKHKLKPSMEKSFGFGFGSNENNLDSKLSDGARCDTFVVGAKLEHEKFGIGSLVKLEGSGDDMRLYIDFKGQYGIKVLIAKYARLSKIF